ncbi:MAG: efflux RND transporter permease subunit [Hyphomicrobiales bacterium]|nr:efflux RND transporter permease subunit [Hyphomicrobiales bacterium]
MTSSEIDPPTPTQPPHESAGRAGAISHFFIERPVLSNVIALVVVLIGLVALLNLPSAQYPNVVPPTVQVTTRYPGASARTLVDSVALPIEQQVNGVENALYMQSTSADDGTYTLAVTFAIGTNPDLAQVLVQNRVAIAFSSLPQEVQLQGVTTKKQSTSILEFVNLSSPDSRFDSLFLSNYAVINVQDELRRLNGVGDVTVLGAGQYAMRVWLNPDLLQARGLVPQDVINIIQQQSQEVTAGQIGAPPVPKGQDFQYTLDLKGRLDDPAEFENIIVKVDTAANGGRITRIRDVGRAELGAQTYSQSFNLDGRPAAGIAISLLPEANAIAVSDEVKAKMEELAKSFPEGLVYGVPYDTTKFVRAAIAEVYRTLIEAAILVLIVILVFLQDWRAMLVPATTVPVTLIGAFAAMAALGFSINLPTLFALVLAIGIVVDDAIVIVEGVARYIERGLPGREAAERAMDDLTGPVLGITLVLMSVFIPAAFVPGLTGQLFRQFALVIAATAFISAINALTLKPTQSALWLRPPKPPEQRNFFTRGFERVYGAVEGAYARLVSAMTRRAGLMVILALALVGVAVYGLTRVPTAFLPTEDQGYLIVPAQLPDGASKERTDAVMQKIQGIASKIPGVEHVVTISGWSILDNRASLANAGAAFVVLKDWDVRLKEPGQDARSIALRIQGALQGVPEAVAFALPPPPIQGVGNVGGFTMQVELKNGNFDYALLQSLTNALVANANSQSSLQRVATTFRAGAPQFFVKVDRIKAERIGVTVGQVFSALSGYIGAGYVAEFNKFGHVFQIYTQSEAKYRATADDIRNLKVKAADGTMTPIGTVVEVNEVQGPSLISLYNLYPSSTVIGGPAPGFSSGQTLDIMDQIGKVALPTGTGYEWTAMSFQEKQVGNQIYYVFGFALLLVYFVLAGQYESWILPFAVILGVPLALLGTVSALTYFGAANVAASEAGVAAVNLYTQIGLILLIALAAKNAILIVEYARQRRGEGMHVVKAAVEGARLRFRPIIMTSFAFILGVFPLVTATGAGASARVSIGIAVFYGMIASTCLVVVFVPSFYVVMQHLEERRTRGRTKVKPAPDAALVDSPGGTH